MVLLLQDSGCLHGLVFLNRQSAADSDMFLNRQLGYGWVGLAWG